MAAKSYRLLRAVLTTAVEEDKITLMARGAFGRYSEPVDYISIMALSWGFGLERAKGIEPS